MDTPQFHQFMQEIAREERGMFNMPVRTAMHEDARYAVTDSLWQQAAEANAKRADGAERRFNAAAVLSSIGWGLFLVMVARELFRR